MIMTPLGDDDGGCFNDGNSDRARRNLTNDDQVIARSSYILCIGARVMVREDLVDGIMADIVFRTTLSLVVRRA